VWSTLFLPTICIFAGGKWLRGGEDIEEGSAREDQVPGRDLVPGFKEDAGEAARVVRKFEASAEIG
jgi:hypothetical protein